MAGQSRIYKLNILADTKGLVDGLNKANNEVSGAGSKIGATFKKVGIAVAAAGAAAGAFAVKYGVDAVKAASDLSETVAKAGQIFGDSAKQVEAFAASAAATLGQSKQQALDAASTFAVFGKSAGLAGDDLVKFSTDFTVLASDLASFNNTTPDEAITAIGSALRGEAEPLRRFGVLLDDASLRAAALELGIVSTTKNALTPQQKVLAAQALIYKQTGDAQGDFLRTSDGLANSQRILTAQIENVKTSIGTALLPVATELFQFIGSKLIPLMTTFSESFSREAGPAIDGMRKVVTDFVLPALKNLWYFITEFVVPTLKNIFTPVIQILQAAFVFLSQKIKENREGFEVAFGIMRKIFEFVRDHLAPVVGGVLATAFNLITRAIGLAIDNFGRVFEIIGKVARFLGFDFDMEVKKATKTVNNLDSGIVDAYKSFNEQSRVVKENVIPALDSVSSAQNAVASSTAKATKEIKEQTRASQDLAKIKRELADDPTGAKTVQAAKDARTRAAQAAAGSAIDRLQDEFDATFDQLIAAGKATGIGGASLGTTGFLSFTAQQAVAAGLGGVSQRDLARSLGAVGMGAGYGGGVTINVNGTVLDPEGVARAIQDVLQQSNARSGTQSLIPAFGLE